MPETPQNVRYRQVRAGDRHGTQKKFQMSDATGLAHNLGKFNPDGSVTDNGICYLAVAETGAANAYQVTITPAPTLVAGSTVLFKAANANTAASTLTVNTFSYPLTLDGTAALISGDIRAGQVVTAVFDGTGFQIGSSGGNAHPYHVIFYLPGPLDAGVAEPVMQWTCPNDLIGGVSFAGDFGGNARGYLQALPSTTVTCQLYKVPAGSAAGTLGTNIGSIVISGTGSFTFTLTPTTFVAGDSLTAWPPSPIDSALQGVGWTLPGMCGAASANLISGSGGTTGTHAEALTDGQGNLIFANGDLIYATGIPG